MDITMREALFPFKGGKYLVQTTLLVQSWKPFKKPYLEVSINYETMHIHSSSIDVRCSKSWEANLLCENPNKYDKTQVQVH